jgi:Predicted SAM-dependent methyltransferase
MNHKPIYPGARLEACASFARKGKVAADIGTDHAYLPIWLIQNHISRRVYASDINEEPINVARKNIEEYALTEKIITFTGDGLEKVPREEVDDIIVAGMGGDNIASIIDGAKWLCNRRYRLILQPMSHTERLREYLYSHGFLILTEKAVCESRRLYTVICAEFSGEEFSFDEYDIYAGRLTGTDPDSAAILKKQAGILRAEAEGMARKGNKTEEERLRSLSERLEIIASGK